MYIKAWVDYDFLIYPPTQSKPSMSLANDNLLKLVAEYHEASQGLSIKQEKKWFCRKKTVYKY